MNAKQKQPEVKRMDFTITRTGLNYWLSAKLAGEKDYVIELTLYDALDLAEEYDIVIRTEENDKIEESEENV